MSTYKLIDGTGSGESKEIEAPDMATAKIEAEEWMRECEWDTTDGTTWVSVHIIDLSGVPEGENEWDYRETLNLTIEPDEPSCTASEHDWQSPLEIVGGIKENPGVWGNGGGVVIHAVCIHCGCERVRDTWAQNSETGEQGVESVTYYPANYADEVEAMRAAEEE